MRGNFPFKFWCHKVLPLVYDDSISYYEFLCKVAKLVNDISEHNVQQDEAISNNNAYIVKLDNEVHNDIVPHLENEISGLETAITNEESARIRGDSEIGARLDKDEENITDLHRQIRWVAKKFGALPYDKEHSYNVGDFCLFNDVGSSEDSTLIYGNIYRCKESTTGEFDSTKWEMINLLQFVERIWSKTLEPFADKYDEDHTWNVDDIVLYGGDEVYGNTGGMPIIYRCINQTTGAFNYDDWTPLRFSWILDKALEAKSEAESALEKCDTLTTDYQNLSNTITDLDSRVENAESEAESALEKCDTLTTDYQNLSNTVTGINQSLSGLDTQVFYGFNSIADNYQEYSGTPLFYPKDSYVWYLDILYKANADVTVDSASVLPPDQNSSWDSVQLTDEIGSGGSGSFDITLLAENYDETNTYDYGECVSKDGKLYVCTATTATGTWDISKWEETNAEGAFANKMRTMRELTELIAELSGGVQIDGTTENVPKYTLGYFAERERSNLYGRRLFYANKATVTGSGFIQQDWTQLLNVGLYGWVKLITNDISRYSEVTTTNITATIEEA